MPRMTQRLTPEDLERLSDEVEKRWWALPERREYGVATKLGEKRIGTETIGTALETDARPWLERPASRLAYVIAGLLVMLGLELGIVIALT